MAYIPYLDRDSIEPADPMTAGDVGRLRQAGLDDRGIHDVCAIVAYFNFVNRMADGLGVELEDGAG